MTADETDSPPTASAFSEGDCVEYAEGKVGTVIGLVPAPPETDDPYVENLWKELINRAAMDEYEEVRFTDDEFTDPRFVVRRETGVTTVFRADELEKR